MNERHADRIHPDPTRPAGRARPRLPRGSQRRARRAHGYGDGARHRRRGQADDAAARRSGDRRAPVRARLLRRASSPPGTPSRSTTPVARAPGRGLARSSRSAGSTSTSSCGSIPPGGRRSTTRRGCAPSSCTSTGISPGTATPPIRPTSCTRSSSASMRGARRLVRQRHAEPHDRERKHEDRGVERVIARARDVPCDQQTDGPDEPELDLKRGLVPVAVVARHRHSGDDQNPDGDERAVAEPTRDPLEAGPSASPRSSGTTATTRKSWPPTKNAIATRCSRGSPPTCGARLPCGAMNFALDVVEAAPPDARAIVELARDGARREWTFGEVAERGARLAGTLAARGVGRGDVVMTLVGNRPEWVLAMVACFRIGAVVLPCTEQLRGKDLRQRLDAAAPAAIVADERDLAELEVAGPDCPVLTVPDESLFEAASRAGRRPAARGAVPDHVHERHVRRPQGRRARSALPPRPAPAGRALARRPPRRARLVHGGERMVQVGAQRLHRPVAAGGLRAPARRPLRSAPAPRAAGAGGRERAVHGAHRVPRHRQAGGAASRARAARPGGGRGGAERRCAAGVGGGHRASGARRLRADGDRAADRQPARRPRAAGVDGPAAARRGAARAGRGARARGPGDRSHLLPRLPRTSPPRRGPGTPGTASARTRTATCSSRGAPTT